MESKNRLAQLVSEAYSQNLNDSQTVRIIENVIDALDHGALRVAEQDIEGKWQAKEWVKQAILLYFRFNPTHMMGDKVSGVFYDKIEQKFATWTEDLFKYARIRVAPGAIVRTGSFIGPNAVLMPCFVNIGAYIGEGTMVDSWATVGSCAQIGKNVHLSGGVGIGGVLEPLQDSPTIIEDGCFIGARSEIVEGCVIGQGSVLSMGVYIGKSTKIIDRETGEIHQGYVPPYSVVVPGSVPSKGGVNLYCAVIVKKVDEKTRAKTSVNELLRGVDS
ncbi:2,3,4,5-tetrahydropyridine-2,6-dicarboxylate N-succinyltransferase [Bartonella sp. TP]|uniref:2,3,4,5-tetrahydropyridine-2,6-dicarboxylate N-succinyltransferase n=1 Tax=Bartonella sp. TP TaxID=3057550 RepID=UPI00339D8AEA